MTSRGESSLSDLTYRAFSSSSNGILSTLAIESIKALRITCGGSSANNLSL